MSFELLQEFHEHLLRFLDQLIERFPEEPDLVIVRVLFANQIPVEDILRNFVSRLLPHADEIKNHNEKFFLENDEIFGNLKENKVLHFKKLWLSSDLEKADRETIWQWFELFVDIAERYTQ